MEPSDTEIAGGDPDFAKITLQKPTGTEASDIDGDITVTIPSNLNAWKNDDKTGGAAPTSYSLDDLPADIYLEGTASSDILDTVVKAEMTLKNGETNTVKCRDEIRYTVIEVKVTGLGFKNDHMITKWTGGAKIDDPDGSVPVWVSGGANDPVCYTKNTAPTMFATFNVTPSISPEITGVQVRAKVGIVVIGSASNCKISGTVIEDNSNTDGDVDGIGGGSAVPNSYDVNSLTPTFKWEVSLDGTKWFPAGDSGPHTMYFTDATPAASPLYDLGLEKACGYVHGNSNIGGSINTGLAGELYYESTGCTHHDLHIFDTGVKRGQCCCHAAVFSLLVSHVTNSSPPSTYLWGGCSSSVRCHYIYGGWWGPTFQCDSPANDGESAHPHFTYHVEVNYGGTFYDPSYGTTGLTTFIETAPVVVGSHPNAATQQTGSGLPGNSHMVQWTCPH